MQIFIAQIIGCVLMGLFMYSTLIRGDKEVEKSDKKIKNEKIKDIFTYTFVRNTYDYHTNKEKDLIEVTSIPMHKNTFRDWYLLEDKIKLSDSVYFKIFDYVKYDEDKKEELSITDSSVWSLDIKVPRSWGYYMSHPKSEAENIDKMFEKITLQRDKINENIILFNPKEARYNHLEIPVVSLLEFCLFLKKDDIQAEYEKELNEEQERIEALKGDIVEEIRQQDLKNAIDSLGVDSKDINIKEIPDSLVKDIERLSGILKEFETQNIEQDNVFKEFDKVFGVNKEE